MTAEFGQVRLSGRPDLTIGQAQGALAGKVIVDFKTGRMHGSHVADLRFYALIDTIRIGTPPRMLATSYLDIGAAGHRGRHGRAAARHRRPRGRRRRSHRHAGSPRSATRSSDPASPAGGARSRRSARRARRTSTPPATRAPSTTTCT